MIENKDRIRFRLLKLQEKCFKIIYYIGQTVKDCFTILEKIKYEKY